MNESAPERTMILGSDNAVPPTGAPPGELRTLLYREGRRVREAATLGEARAAVREDPALFAWISMTAPNQEQLREAAHHFELPRLALEDAIVAHQRPKVETYRDVLFVVLRPARYDRSAETVEVGEIHMFGGTGFAITIRHTRQIDFEDVRAELEAQPWFLALGSPPVVHAVVNRVVDAYAPVIFDFQDSIDEAESEVLDGAPAASRHTYRLARQAIHLHRAIDPLDVVLSDLTALLDHSEEADPGLPKVSDQHRHLLHNYLRDVTDHVTAAREHVEGFRQLLQNIMEVNSALIGQSQNEAMKKVSSWGGILVVPTLISSVFGMNIAPQPGFHWVFSWPLVLLFMVATSVGLYVVFKRNDWL